MLQGVLINRGWEVDGAEGDAGVARLARVPLARLCPSGFVFIWADKAHVRRRSLPPTLIDTPCALPGLPVMAWLALL